MHAAGGHGRGLPGGHDLSNIEICGPQLREPRLKSCGTYGRGVGSEKQLIYIYVYYMMDIRVILFMT